jgi:hypothetical protein
MTKIHKPLKMRHLGAHCMKSITNVDMPVYMIKMLTVSPKLVVSVSQSESWH